MKDFEPCLQKETLNLLFHFNNVELLNIPSILSNKNDVFIKYWINVFFYWNIPDLNWTKRFCWQSELFTQSNLDRAQLTEVSSVIYFWWSLYYCVFWWFSADICYYWIYRHWHLISILAQTLASYINSEKCMRI